MVRTRSLTQGPRTTYNRPVPAMEESPLTKESGAAAPGKQELIEDIKQWIDAAICRLNTLKEHAARIVDGEGAGEMAMDARTWGLLHTIINVRRSKLKIKRELSQLKNDVRKENQQRKGQRQKAAAIAGEQTREINAGAEQRSS